MHIMNSKCSSCDFSSGYTVSNRTLWTTEAKIINSRTGIYGMYGSPYMVCTVVHMNTSVCSALPT